MARNRKESVGLFAESDQEYATEDEEKQDDPERRLEVGCALSDELNNRNSIGVDVDPSITPTRDQTEEAFEWLRSVALTEPYTDGPSLHAAILMREIVMLNEKLKALAMAGESEL